MSEDQQFFVGQKAVIARGGEILVMFDPEFGADLPGGKIKAGELDFVKELKREVSEETTLDISVGNVFATGYFEVPTSAQNKNAGRKIFNVYYACRYESGEVSMSTEHNRYEWVSKENFMEKVDRQLIKDVLAKYFALHPDSMLSSYIKRHKSV